MHRRPPSDNSFISDLTGFRSCGGRHPNRRLIKDRASCQYSCCGRTDKGVSALGQVVSLLLRTSNRPVHRKRPRSTQDGSESQTGKQQNACEQAVVGDSSFEQPSVSAGELDIDETGLRIPDIDYCRVLNNALPKDIAVVGSLEPRGVHPRTEIDGQICLASECISLSFWSRCHTSPTSPAPRHSWDGPQSLRASPRVTNAASECESHLLVVHLSLPWPDNSLCLETF